jgi:hypothetical protein
MLEMLTHAFIQRTFDPRNYDAETECPSCLEVFDEHSELIYLNCGNGLHYFHDYCMVQIISAGHKFCPLCNSPIDEDDIKVLKNKDMVTLMQAEETRRTTATTT